MLTEMLAEYAEQRLYEWGNWSRNGEGLAKYIGNMQMIQKNGGVFVKSSGPRPLGENEHAEQIDRWINIFKKVKPQDAKILIYAYRSRKPREHQAEVFKLSINRFNERLKRGRDYIEVRLAEEYEKNIDKGLRNG